MHTFKIFLVALLALFLESSSAICRGDKNAYPSDCSNQCVNNCESKACTLACQQGCSCKEGYVYDGAVQKCVLPKACTACGGDPNAYHSDCSNQCINNCDPLVCTLGCVKGCSCKQDYVFDNYSQRCVLHDDCRKRGGYN